MKAVRVVAPGHVEVQRDVTVPEPGTGEVLLRVAAAGVCGTDLELREAPEAMSISLPRTLGHEICGRVEKLGDSVTDPPVGQLVAVFPMSGCGHCVCCRRGEDNICRTSRATVSGVDRDGGLAEYVVVPAINAFDASGIAPEQAATCTDAALTSYRAVRIGLGLQPGAGTVVVIGIGGLGHLALQVLTTMTKATVVAVDTDAAKLELARTLGADHAVEAGADARQQVLDIAGGQQTDLVLDFVGAQPTLDLAVGVIGKGGSIVAPGVGGGTLAYHAAIGDPLGSEISAIRTVNGSRPDLGEVLDLARHGHLHARTTLFAIDDALDAFQRLEDGQISGRAVVTFDGA